ncbi:NAD(P)/FAD-dependent oxidoreductase [Nesterenkonia ebinurensis]|uniref:hypothetical protein n=1 Tax=Nesterenkonia ebinurensis TaxID=2608252 RepID=UPI00123E2AA2
MVIGGGFTAVEIAAEIAEHHPHLDVSLRTHGTLAVTLPVKSQTRARKVLESLSADIHEEEIASADASSPHEADLVIWCTGFTVPRLAKESGLDVEADGRLRVTDIIDKAVPPQCRWVVTPLTLSLPLSTAKTLVLIRTAISSNASASDARAASSSSSTATTSPAP